MKEDNKKVSINKKYRTRDGRQAEVIFVPPEEELGRYPVTGSVVVAIVENIPSKDVENIPSKDIILYDIFGKYLHDVESQWDLFEVQKYEGFKNDDPVIVWDSKTKERLNRHFAYERGGYAYVWPRGLTSFTADWKDPFPYDNCIRADQVDNK